VVTAREMRATVKETLIVMVMWMEQMHQNLKKILAGANFIINARPVDSIPRINGRKGDSPCKKTTSWYSPSMPTRTQMKKVE
jgi:hypothetical protein